MAFECGICASMFNTGPRIPLILECGHTFCQSCVQHNLGGQRCCPYCRHPIQKHVDELPRNYALENAMEAANLPLVELMDRWGLANAERMMVKADQLQLVSLMSRKGHTGEVWKGTLWGKPVAVKVLPLMDVEQRQLECLRREVAVLLHTTGECKQVCIYKGFCVKDGSFAIIMRLYSYSLAARVARAPGHRLPLPLALKYALDITKGLVELHRLGVTAADLKPDNVLIDDELGDAVIADFGISSVVTTTLGNGSGRGTAVRSSGALRGTPNYMAPEQFAPGARPTNKVDIWGFAATLLHMITGSPPWQHDTLLQICTAVGVAKQAPPLPEGLPPQLQALLLSCFEADPARRPAAVYLLRALQALVPILQQQAPVQLPAPQHQQQHAAAATKQQPAAVDDKRRGLDQYLAQLGLKQEGSPSSSSGGGGMPSAPPLPRTSSGGYSTSPALAASSGACISAHERSASCGSGGGSITSSGSRVRAKLPRVLWSEEEALQEQQQQQGLDAGSTAAAAAKGQHRPAWAPHHGRSASEQVSGMTSRGAQQHQQMLQALQPQEVAGAAQWLSSEGQQQHTRSRSDAWHGWSSAAAEAAGGDLASSRRQQGGPESHMLPTHFEAGYSPESAAAAADERAAAGDGAARRQRQQWQIPAHPAEQADGSSMQHCEQIFSPRGHDCPEEAAGTGHSKWPAKPSSETGAANGMTRHEPADGMQQQQQQQQLAAGLQCTNYWDMPPPASDPTPDAAAAAGSSICSSSGKVPLPLKPLDAAAGEEAAGSLARHSNGACSSNGQTESCSGRTASGPPSVSGGSRCGSARRNQRTLGNLLLGRAPSSRSFRAAEAAADARGSCSSTAAGGIAAGSSTGSYSSGLSAIRMAFGPASPDRMPRGSLSSGSSGIPSPATAVAVAAAGGVAVASAAAAAVSAGAAVGKDGLACAASASTGAALTAADTGMKTAAPVVISVTAASATAAASGGGVVAAMASRFSKGAKASSKDHQPAAVVPLSPGGCSSSGSSSAEKNGRWRSLFGSPSRRQAVPPVASQAAAGVPCSMQSPSSQLSGPSVLDGSGVRSAHSSANGSVSCGDGACRAGRTCSSPSTHLAPAGSPGRAGGLMIVPPAGDGASIELPKLQGTPPGSAQAAAAHAISEADRASGACSPLRAHAHNLSLHAKGTAAASAESTPMASPNPVAPAAAASPSGAARQQQPDSPSKGQQQQPGSSSGDGSGAVGGSHSQVLAEAVQLEARARSLSLSGRHEESEAALRASLALLGKQLGAGHPNTIAATTRLALQLNRHGKHAEAERLLRQVLTTKQAVLGRKHPQVAAASINLAACLYSQSHFNAAARLYSTALEIRRAALGDTHADTAACLNNLALCHSRLSEWPQAEQLFREALSARVAALGQLHPDVAITAHQLGHCLGQLGQHTEALVYHKQGLWVRQQQDRHAGSGTPDGAAAGSRSRGSGSGGGSSAAEDLVSSHRCVALCLARLGCDKQAGEHLSAVLDARSKQLAALDPPPPPGSATGGAAGGRGAGHCRAVSSTNAAGMDNVDWSILAEGDGRLSKAQSDALLAMAAAAEELGRCLSRQGRHSEAEEQFWRALEARSQVLGSRHEAVAATEEQLRACLEQQC